MLSTNLNIIADNSEGNGCGEKDNQVEELSNGTNVGREK